MPLPSALLPQTFDLYRPWGAAEPTLTNQPCRLQPRISGQRVGGSPPPLFYTHYLIVNASVDIRDGCSRVPDSSQIAFGMGDEVRIPSGSPSTRYAVVWVEYVGRGQSGEYKRVYLTRDEVSWPGP